MIYRKAPQNDVFIDNSKQIPEPIKYFFQNISEQMKINQSDLLEIWEEEVDELIKNSSLSKNESEILKQFGRTLGQHDYLQQQKHIHLTATYLDSEHEDAKDYQLRYGTMAQNSEM